MENNKKEYDIKFIASLCDLTDLTGFNGDDSALKNQNERVVRLENMTKMAATITNVAAACVYPENVTIVRRLLPPKIKIATVVNFPSASLSLAEVLTSIKVCVNNSEIDEIDIVMPYKRLIAGDIDYTHDFIKQCRKEGQTKTLKLIIESGMLTTEQIKQATLMACENDIDFVKTSTGKIKGHGASKAAVVAILEVLKDRRNDTTQIPGLKISGGVNKKNIHDYLSTVEKYMEWEWMRPSNLRIGTSQLIQELLER